MQFREPERLSLLIRLEEVPSPGVSCVVHIQLQSWVQSWATCGPTFSNSSLQSHLEGLLNEMLGPPEFLVP